MTLLARKLRAFLWRDFLQDASYRVYFVSQGSAVLLNIVAYFFLARFVGGGLEDEMQRYGGDLFAFLLVGVAFNGYQKVAVQSFNLRIREAQMMGTFEALLATRTPPGQIIVGSAVYDFAAMSLRVFAYLLLGGLFFGVDFSRANYPAAAVVFLLSIFAFLCIGIGSGAFIVMFKKGDPVSWVFSKLGVPLSGVLYPISVLPEALQVVSQCLPLTHAIEGLRLTLLEGASLGEIRGSLLGLAIFSILLFPASLWLFRVALRWSKERGGLVQF